MKKKSFQYGPETSEALKTHSALLPFKDLPEDEQESNRRNVRDIVNKLSVAGYLMRPARSHERVINFPQDSLDLLARMEHERWVEAKLAAGWQLAPETDKPRKLHKSLVPWDKLPQEEKDKDHDLVRGIPRVLAKAGFAVEKTG